MALDQYTKGQKIFLASLAVLLAATFTVTGAMMTIFSGPTPPTEAATVDGRDIRVVEFHRVRAALYRVRQLDQGSSPFGNEKLEYLYARVPTLASRQEDGHDWPYNATEPRNTSLLDIWPVWQDQHVYCHMALIKRAREAGVEEPSPARIGAMVAALMNAGRKDEEKFDASRLKAEFKLTFGEEIEQSVPTFQEALMVREYVDSLLADQRASLDQVAAISAGDSEELRAQFARLDTEAFAQRAREEVRREHFAGLARGLAGGFGVAGLPHGNDPFEEMFDKNRHKEMQAEAEFEFDVIMADPEAMRVAGKVPFEEERARTLYLAVRDEMFKATDEDKKNIETRLKDEENAFAGAAGNVELVKNWKEEDWKAWREKQRPELEKYRSFREASAELRGSLSRENSLMAAQTAILELQELLRKEKQKRERELNAGLDALRAEREAKENVKGYLESLRSQFDSLERQVNVQLGALANRLAAGDGSDAAVKALAEDLARTLQDVQRHQVEALVATASAASQQYERDLNNKLAVEEEFRLQDKKKDEDSDEDMTEAQVAARLERFRHEIAGIRERIKARDAKHPLVRDYAETMKSVLAGYELAARAATEGDAKLRAEVLAALLVEIPARVAKLNSEQRDRIVPQDEIENWAGQADIVRADHDARQNSLSKDAADTRSLNLADMCKQLGLTITETAAKLTWEKLLGDERFRQLESVEGAKDFLESPVNYEGAVSGVMAMPGKGYLMLRLRTKTAKYPQGRGDAAERTLKLAELRRARELTIDAMEELRREIIKDGWDAAVGRARQKYGAHLEVGTTGFFTDKMDLPEISSEGDSDLLAFSASSSPANPESPFISRLRQMKPEEGVTELVPERRNTDALKRPDRDRWAYTVARISERKPVSRRMEKDALTEQMWGSSPAQLWRNRHLASSSTVRELIEPASLLKGSEIIRYLDKERKDNSGDDKGT